jgi:hypothetical protein
MMFLLLYLLQGRTPLSWVVIAAAVVAFAAGVSLLVYFYKRYKRLEKETEEDWEASRHSLFVHVQPPQPKTEAFDTPTGAEAETLVAEEETVNMGATREFASDLNLPSFAATTVEPESEAEPAVPEAPISAPIPVSHEPRPTEILASPSPQPPVSKAKPEPIPEPAPFDEAIWAGLSVEGEAVDSEPASEPLIVARVEERSHREAFETPRIERISYREQYEPPSIEPLTPREAAATRELRSAGPMGLQQPEPERPEEPLARGTVRLGSVSDEIARPLDSHLTQRETRELAGEFAVTAPATVPEAPISAGAGPRARSFGSILGLPTEASHQPLILGEPVRPAEEEGIGALTHYGEDLGPKGGRAGKIALFIVLALLAGAAATYFFVPSVHSRVDEFISRLRGVDAQDRDAIKTKAQIIPSSRPEVNKNMVTARGAVDNISDEPLVGLEVEVSLRRGDDAPSDIRRIPVTPDPLPPGERGSFEFEYDGKRDTGFAGYTIIKLLSNGVEVRFRTPPQP